ncbi:glycoside hydrolase family 3 protein [Rhodococcus sp. CX]|uniref:beta-glucosidase family protein n=1 Tax=Rhodococcus sp. CX TaxID=2789880 RepID=UPI0018CCE3BA|nr:glycoside hydrolase family 3 protein [Rhodococcus sp. CX]MBH0119900.1 glycoside hydrolase family 3 protein [Rhodococcus sp. CX]
MTDDERFSLLISVLGEVPGSTAAGTRDPRIPEEVTNMSAGYTPGVPRLGIPAIQSSDAGMGVTNPGYRPDDEGATAFPSSIALGSSFNPRLVREGGEAIGREARARGFNVQLAGGCNLARDPRNGRNFEYYSEDPYLSAVLAAEQVDGIQSQGVVSTLKHYTLNCNETNRHWLDAIIDPDAHRESDLLTFQIAIERSQPGAIMSGYNKIDGEYAGGNHHLLNEVLKGAWGYPGYVMSDWGATPQWQFALAGLDQESGVQADLMLWGKQPFADELRDAYVNGELPAERLSDMVRRILRSLFAVGVDRWGPAPEVDMAEHNRIALEGARQGIVLLKNDGVLPIPSDRPLAIAVIGGYAQQGVISGTGSGAVAPVGGFAGVIKIGGAGVMGKHRNLFLFPPSPLEELEKFLPQAHFDLDPGYTPAEAALTAKRSDMVIVFGIRVEGEGFDSVLEGGVAESMTEGVHRSGPGLGEPTVADLSLPWGQDAVIDAVASANANTIVVLETGNPVSMPWRDKVKAIVQAWYPGQAGGQAIAEVLSGAVNPSGRLPITFPESLEQTPRPELPGLGTPWGTAVTIEYNEGAEVGYRWFAETGARPMYAFGHGLGYTTFEYSDLAVTGGDTVTATFTVSNTGDRPGADVPQLYLTEAAGERRQRLLGFERVELQPGTSHRVTLVAEPRLLARFDGTAGKWRITEGTYKVAVGKSADSLDLTAETTLTNALFGS